MMRKSGLKGTRLLKIFSLSFLVVCSWHCGLDQLAPPNIYESCCETAPVSMVDESHTILIPNAITPNDDGENDAFSIYSRNPMQITDLMVENEWQTLSIRRKNIRVEGMTSIWEPVNLNGNKVHGLFNYQIKMVDEIGDTIAVRGEFCSIDCKEKDSDEIHYPDCLFESQSDQGSIDTSLIVYENNCLF